MDATAILFIMAALALGALLGWLLGSRGAAAGKGVADLLRLQLDAVREERDAHAGALDTMRSDHGRMLDSLRAEHARASDELRGAHHELATRHAATVAAQEQREQAFEERLAEINAAKEALGAQFAEVGGKLLESAQKQFLERADQRFKESEATSGNPRSCSRPSRSARSTPRPASWARSAIASRSVRRARASSRAGR